MPTFRKLSESELKVARPLSPRAQLAQAYDALLDGFAAGDYGEAALLAGERRLTVRKRLQAAAGRRGLALRFRPGPLPALIFQVDLAPPIGTRPQAAPDRSRGQGPALPLPAEAPAQAARPQRRARESAKRYDDVLPRWMREDGKGRRGR